MKNLYKNNIKFIYILSFFLLISTNANAYLALGAIIPFIGSSILFFFVCFLSILGFFLYPLILLIKKLKKTKNNDKKNKSKT